MLFYCSGSKYAKQLFDITNEKHDMTLTFDIGYGQTAQFIMAPRVLVLNKYTQT